MHVCRQGVNLWVVMMVIVFSALSVLSFSQRAYAQVKQEKSMQQARQEKKSTNRRQVPNPHWQRDGCSSCHRGKPTRKKLGLRESSVDKLCSNCHDKTSSHSYIHPVGMKPTKEMLKRMPSSFRRALESMKGTGGQKVRGTVGCATCHDLPATCLAERAGERGLNPLFFRGGPYRRRTELCFRCHDATGYQRLNPHDQITKSGRLREDSCMVCHSDASKLKEARSINEVDFNVAGDLTALCTGCHPWKPHPGGAFSFSRSGKGPEHLVKPSASILRQLNRSQRKHEVVFPLEPGSNKVFCGTCHNVHEKGVIKVAAAAKGADSTNRLRVKEICVMCHDK